ncbi:LacI family DNA-binding transcriptional regulator [Promicromonospora panici]|uniref:LacI family DNA-binding transcriptional regulator n=1 Tax=Promicromonospora panici TaxID=2219658 RepID=UPI00101DADF0|nr:LacI family DNA-binding transcriptional regulator [Promicromonospora panici]
MDPRQPSRGTTIYDVAKVCGVAPSTVSRALNHPGRVSPRTAQAILDAADRLGYQQPAPIARTSTPVIGLVLSDITNPAYFDLIRGAGLEAVRRGVPMVLAETRESQQTERDTLTWASTSLAGVVLVGSRMPPVDVRRLARRLPVVVVNRVVPGVTTVGLDNGQGVRLLMVHLASLGHDQILYVGGPTASWADVARWAAARDVGAELGVRVRRSGSHEPTIAGGERAVRAVVSSGVSAVVTYNDLVAIGLLRGLTDLGVRVPADMSVAGFDDTFCASFTRPALTTVCAPYSDVGAKSVSNLIDLLTGLPVEPRPSMLPVSLVIRDSTGVANLGNTVVEERPTSQQSATVALTGTGPAPTAQGRVVRSHG